MTDKFIIFKHLIDTVCAIGKSQGRLITENGHKGITTGLPSNSFNWIMMASFDKPMLDKLKALGAPFACYPSQTTEEGFGSFAEQNGLVRDGTGTAQEFRGLGLWQYKTAPGIDIRKVSNEEDLQQFDRIASIAFNDPPGLTARFMRPALAYPEINLFLASVGGVDAGGGMLSLVNGMAGMYWGCVLPEYRRRGIATALTEHRMNFVKEKGLESVCVQNAPSSLSYYQKIGFKPAGTLTSYDFGK